MDTSVRWGPPAPGTKDGDEEAAPVHRRDGVDGPGGSGVPLYGSPEPAEEELPGMSITMIGLDTAKPVFQVPASDGAGGAVMRRKLRRSELIPFFEQQEACTVVVEACGAAPHWARLLGGPRPPGGPPAPRPRGGWSRPR